MLIVMMMLIVALVPSVRKCVCGKKRGQATSRRLILGDTSDELAVDNPVFDGDGEYDDDDDDDDEYVDNDLGRQTGYCSLITTMLSDLVLLVEGVPEKTSEFLYNWTKMRTDIYKIVFEISAQSCTAVLPEYLGL